MAKCNQLTSLSLSIAISIAPVANLVGPGKGFDGDPGRSVELPTRYFALV